MKPDIKPAIPTGGSTHYESLGEGYSVCIRHCEVCDVYLGVNYPSDFCDEHNPRGKK